MIGRAEFAGERGAGGGSRLGGAKARPYIGLRSRSRKNWAELAGGEGVQLAKAIGEFGGGYAALAAEGAEKILGGGLSFLRVAFDAAGNEVAVGIFPPASQWDDMVEAARARGKLGQAIEAEPAVARMNGFAAGFG